MTRPTPETPSASPASRRLYAGGLPKVPHGHMPTLFSLFIFWWVLTSLGFVFLPFVLHRFSDSVWTDPTHIAVWSALSFVSAMHGFLAYLTTYRRGGTPMAFFVGAVPGLVVSFALENFGLFAGWGAVAFPVTMVAIFMATATKPASDPAEAGPFFRLLNRLAYMCGNIWFGIAQILSILVAISWATIYETSVGMGLGSEAAYAKFYNANWFGALCLLFFVTLYCATMRKWPFRISQIGWLFVHAGLLILIIGCLAMFYGGFEGRLMMIEGETSDLVYSSRDRELVVNVPSFGSTQKFLLKCDRDPMVSDVDETIDFSLKTNSGEDKWKVTIDRYFSNAEAYEQLIDVAPTRTEPDMPGNAGVEVEIVAPGQTLKRALVEGNPNRQSLELGPLSMGIVRAPNEEFVRGFSHRYGADDPMRGKLVAHLGEKGDVIAEMPIKVGRRDDDPTRGAELDVPEKTIESAGFVIRPVRYFSYFAQNESQGFFDANPNVSVSPGILVEVQGTQGVERYIALSDGTSQSLRRTGEKTYGVRFRYLVTPELYTPGWMYFVVGPAEQKRVIVTPREGGTRILNLEVGQDYKLSENAPIRVRPTRFVADCDITGGFRQAIRETNVRALHLTVSNGSGSQQTWLLSDRGETSLKVGATMVRLAYKARRTTLDHKLSLLDFRQFDYPNSTKPKAYETNVVIEDQKRNVREAVLIDMNHPLDYRGMRFFNSGPILDEESRRRGIQLQVTTNPGYSTIIVGSIAVTLGILIVFFLKPKLRTWETRRAAAARLQGAHASQ